MNERDAFTMSPQSWVRPYLHTSARLPPCAPTPGTSKKLSGAYLRMFANSVFFVAPTTYIIRSAPAQVLAFFITTSYKGPSLVPRYWKSWLPAEDVSASKITHLPG